MAVLHKKCATETALYLSLHTLLDKRQLSHSDLSLKEPMTSACGPGPLQSRLKLDLHLCRSPPLKWLNSAVTSWESWHLLEIEHDVKVKLVITLCPVVQSDFKWLWLKFRNQLDHLLCIFNCFRWCANSISFYFITILEFLYFFSKWKLPVLWLLIFSWHSQTLL